MKNYKIVLFTFYILCSGCNNLYSQKDTLYVQNNDTLTLSIDQKFPSTIFWIHEDSLKEVSVYLHLITNSKATVILENASTGDGPLIFISDFNNPVGGTVVFKNGNCFGKLLYSVDEIEGKAVLKEKGVSLKIVESSNSGLISSYHNFKFVGKREY